MISVIKFQTKPNAFVLADLEYFDRTFVEVRVSRGACISEMWLYQRICIAVDAKRSLKVFAYCIGILFIIPLIVLKTLVAIACQIDCCRGCIPGRLITLECCLISISLYRMSRLGELFNLLVILKRIDLVFSSPKCMLSLLSINHLQSELKSLFSWSSIVLISFPIQKRQTSSA